ncbi:hypothetical protein MMC24_003091 [Lignoscripta atroalba]|nr:hypothetical protein [Lignoscripta atroalba]
MSTTETCFCGAVQLAFSIEGDDLVNTFVCNCTDCHKVTASMFASNFTIRDTSLKYVRGQHKIKTFAMTKTIASGNTMTNYFCSVCGSLMYRVSSGWPGTAIMRIGQVDDLTLHGTTLKPQLEMFTKNRVAWVKGPEGAEQYRGNYFDGETERSEV